MNMPNTTTTTPACPRCGYQPRAGLAATTACPICGANFGQGTTLPTLQLSGAGRMPAFIVGAIASLFVLMMVVGQLIGHARANPHAVDASVIAGGNNKSIPTSNKVQANPAAATISSPTVVSTHAVLSNSTPIIASTSLSVANLSIQTTTPTVMSMTTSVQPTATQVNTTAVLPTAIPLTIAPKPTSTRAPDASVNTTGVNLRAGPGEAYTILTHLDGGTPLTVRGKSADGDWLWVVIGSGQSGWVSADPDLVVTNIGLSTLLVVAAPPLPTSPPRPTAVPVAPSVITAPSDGAPANPWGYNFTRGSYIYSPPASFCLYFDCIKNFGNGRGYVMQCRDGTFSKSGGIQGSCSQHGGNARALLSP